MARDVDTRSQGHLERHRRGGIRPFHVLGVTAVAVVGVVVAFWALSFVAGVIWALVKAAVVVAVVGGLLWLVARRRRR